MSEFRWLSEPPVWTATSDGVALTTAAQTDFWRHTHYGFVRDDGHFFHQQVRGDFHAAVRVAGEYRDQYDQAGLMVRADPEHWLKCGVEYVDGVRQVSAVVTQERSDWGVAPCPEGTDELRIVVERHGDALEVRYGEPGVEQMLRLADFPAPDSLEVGPMAASPTGPGFSARLTALVIEPLGGPAPD